MKLGVRILRLDIEKSNGGTTLEMPLDAKNIMMPAWHGNKPIVVREWGKMSEADAEGASGHVRGVIGKDLRPGNVWGAFEKMHL